MKRSFGIQLTGYMTWDKFRIAFVHLFLIYLVCEILMSVLEIPTLFRVDWSGLIEASIQNPVALVIWTSFATIVFLILVSKTKIISGGSGLLNGIKNEYRSNASKFVLSTFGFLLLVSGLLSWVVSGTPGIGFYLKLLYEQRTSIDPEAIAWEVGAIVLVVGAVFVASLQSFAIWKRLRVALLPFFVTRISFFIFGIADAILDCFRLQKGWDRPESTWVYVFNEILISDLFLPFCFLLMGYLLYSWDWFEATKIYKDPKLPKLMNSSWIYWSVTVLVTGTGILRLAISLHWILGPHAG